jgi:uncharacterized membrane protein
VSDGLDARTFETPGLVVSHRATTLTFDDVSNIFEERCAGCHNANNSIPGLFQDFREYDDTLVGLDNVRGVSSRRGLIYRRIAIQRNMPPGSLSIIGEAITEAERADLIDWLLGGAPQ